jgi:hypothetical protein
MISRDMEGKHHQSRQPRKGKNRERERERERERMGFVCGLGGEERVSCTALSLAKMFWCAPVPLLREVIRAFAAMWGQERADPDVNHE